MCDARQISTRGVSQGVQRHVLAWATWFGSTVGAHSGVVPTVFERLTRGRRTSSRRPGTGSGPMPPRPACGLEGGGTLAGAAFPASGCTPGTP